MAYTRIKICGITRPEDAQVIAASGADAIGLVFYAPSPRAVDVAVAAEIVAAVTPLVSVVALFVNEPAAGVERILSAVPIDLLQFHGDEPASYCQQFNRPYLKAVRMKPGLDLAATCQAWPDARGVLLDSWQEGVPGGTGKTFDWAMAEQQIMRPMVLAGGLGPDNVGQAIRQLRPAAVDVSGGVERAPGIKDAEKVRQFVAAVRSADVE